MELVLHLHPCLFSHGNQNWLALNDGKVEASTEAINSARLGKALRTSSLCENG